MDAYLPEWQIQQIIVDNPRLLEVPGRFEGIRIRAEQRYLPSVGGYIDLLCKPKLPRGWLIVELKAEPIEGTEPANQVLVYREGLAAELRVNRDQIYCMVAAPGPLSPRLEELYEARNVSFRSLNRDALVSSSRFGSHSRLDQGFVDREIIIRRRRQQTTEAASAGIAVSEDSVRNWIRQGVHDEDGFRQLALILQWLSRRAPIFAHEVRTSPSELDTFESQWFWLFYSAIDRRGNATLFDRARQQLLRESLFLPHHIADLKEREGEEKALEKITAEFSKARVPLVVDLKLGRYSLAKSVVDAAECIRGFGYDFDRMLRDLSKECGKRDLGLFVLNHLRKGIYGVGPRSAAQFIRGMVLKGPWRISLNHAVFLEETKYNALFAGPARLAIAIQDYKDDSKLFADRFFPGGDKSRLSHALWYIRKRYCDKVPQCFECPVAGYCAYYRDHAGRRPKQTPNSNPQQTRNFAQSSLVAYSQSEGPTK